MGPAGLRVVEALRRPDRQRPVDLERRPADPDFFAELLELELALCDQEPFVRVGGMYQLVATAQMPKGAA